MKDSSGHNRRQPPGERPPAPTFAEAARYWLKLGFISFGGPAGQIAIMHQEIVERRRWISERRFLHALNFCMLLPGPEAQQLAVYMGWLLHRLPGGILAGSFFVLPSLVLLMGLSWVYLAFGDLTVVRGLFAGIKPAVVAIVLFAAWRIGSRSLKSNPLRLLAAAAFLAVLAFGVAFPIVVLAAALVGAIGGRLWPDAFRTGGAHGSSVQSYGPAVIDDDTVPAPHVRFHPTRFALVLVAGLGIWAAGLAAIIRYDLLVSMGWFFTKAALLTFGGAYAVLPYVFQGAVEQHHWLSAAQMMDGLALGETTPGPLIMIVAFVGFAGGWQSAMFGPDLLPLAGIAGASVATFFTFLPSFLFILSGAPLIESTHGDLRFTAPLTAISAAVVGVVLHLGVFLAWHLFWPEAGPARPFAGSFAWHSALLSLAAFLALRRFKIGIVKVIAACALVGLTFVLAGIRP